MNLKYALNSFKSMIAFKPLKSTKSFLHLHDRNQDDRDGPDSSRFMSSSASSFFEGGSSKRSSSSSDHIYEAVDAKLSLNPELSEMGSR